MMEDVRVIRLPWPYPQNWGMAILGRWIIISSRLQDPFTLKRLLVHEGLHIRQQREDGPWTWLRRYLTSDAWRLFYEAPAYATNVVAFWSRNRNVWEVVDGRAITVLDHYAAILHSQVYFLNDTFSFNMVRQAILAYTDAILEEKQIP